ncbi:MAG: DUF5658 family protein [Bryobacter sp.]|nr:DUF5658 family protein [Bryobacter sp.]
MQFAYLQTLDLLSTAAFLAQGVEEGNPVVRLVLSISPNPLYGLALVKGGALVLAIATLCLGKEGFLAKVNYCFAALIVWNLACLVLASV